MHHPLTQATELRELVCPVSVALGRLPGREAFAVCAFSDSRVAADITAIHLSDLRGRLLCQRNRLGARWSSHPRVPKAG